MGDDSGLGIGIFGVLGLVYLAIVAVSIWATVRIIQRAGYSGWWVLMALVPIANIVMFFVFAFAEWPVHRELAQLRAAVGGGYGGAYGGGYGDGYGGGYGGGPASGGFSQPAYGQSGHPASGGFAQPGHPQQSGDPQAGYPQAGYP